MQARSCVVRERMFSDIGTGSPACPRITFGNRAVDTANRRTGFIDTENRPACVRSWMAVVMLKGQAVVKRLHFLNALTVWLSNFSELCVVQFC